MADIIAIVTLAVLFPACLLYVTGCDRLKGGRSMIENIILLALSALLLVYLVYALLRPEKF